MASQPEIVVTNILSFREKDLAVILATVKSALPILKGHLSDIHQISLTHEDGVMAIAFTLLIGIELVPKEIEPSKTKTVCHFSDEPTRAELREIKRVIVQKFTDYLTLRQKHCANLAGNLQTEIERLRGERE